MKKKYKHYLEKSYSLPLSNTIIKISMLITIPLTIINNIPHT
jgi:hypothetical protein